MDARAEWDKKEDWTNFLARLPASHPVREAILESWRRSHQAGRRPAEAPPLRRVSGEDLAERLRRNALLITAAKYHVPPLMALLPGTTNVGYVTDADGIILWSIGDPEQIATFGLAPGFDWSEEAMGTNGAGTALKTGSPTAVIGEEHYLAAFHNCTCTAAPVRSPAGEVIGALDVSSSVLHAHPGRLVGVADTARRMGESLRWLR